ncbi:ribokinase [Arenicella xantha]|uniref:Ribokinase n=1 Tax=Arenicella xantha TaxID=644221 RepID=A0A395JMH7_9GAMM|nr:ribokinase [Arenicella xantha]RBP52854.1 ribokinase [Arenicella xantha]
MSRPIINIGSINIDYVYRVPHFVQPGETLASQTLSKGLGGKGANQSVAIAAAGGHVQHVGQVHQSDVWAVEQLTAAGVGTDAIQLSSEASGHAIIQVDDAGENAIVLHGGANQTLKPDTVSSVLTQHSEAACLLLQNECNLLADSFAIAHELGVAVVLNPAPMTQDIIDLPLHLLDTLIVNQGEAQGLTGEIAIDDVVRTLRDRLPNTRLVITLGAQGALLAHSGKILECAAEHVTAVDTTGAGDTFVGYFLAGVVAGLSDQDSLARACLASAIAVTRSGAISSIPTLDELSRYKN